MTSKHETYGSTPEILVVDDNPTNLDLLNRILTGEGYRVAVAPSGAIALSIAPRIKPDLILLDVMMPGQDGFETCRQLKENEQTRNIPVVFVTALGQAENIVAGFNAGAVDYINKPVHQEEVCARVRLHLSHQMRLTSGEITPKHNTSAAIITACPPGIIESANPPALQMFGYSLMELIGKPLSFLVSPESAQECTYDFETKDGASEYEHATAPFQTLGRRSDGSAVRLDISIRRLSLSYPMFVCLMYDLGSQMTVDYK